MDMFSYVSSNFIMGLSYQIKEYKKIEENKLDFKRQWYEFKKNGVLNKDAVLEFCKDVAAMANTVGDKGLIIIGLDEGTGGFFHSPIKDSGVEDLTLLRGFVARHVDLPPTFVIKEIHLKKKIISVICIPPSLEKPHVLKFFRGRQNFIPVRKNTATCPASRSDIEYMYFDRKNIEPEYQLIAEILGKENIFFHVKEKAGKKYLHILVDVLIQNTGRRPIAIKSTELSIESKVAQVKTVNARKYSVIDSMNHITDIPLQRPLILGANSALNAQVEFISDPLNDEEAAYCIERLESMRAYRALIRFETNGGYLFKSNKI